MIARRAVATLPPEIPFLDALATWWLGRADVEAAQPDAWLALVADGLFLLPTRRAARSLSDAFLRAAAGRPLLLPRIMAFGDADETPLALVGALDLPEAVAAPRRLAVLSSMILAMGGRHGAPVTADRAWRLAADLATLLDEAARAEIDLAGALPGLVADDFAAHWSVTLEFLLIVTETWPAWLREEAMIDPVARQIRLLDAQGEAWRTKPPPHAVIAAGSTGAIPAVARLLRVVAGLPQGQIVLPGLDLDLDDEGWQALDATHPQASLRHLLEGLGVARGEVVPWHIHPPLCPVERVAALRLALLPAASLERWRQIEAIEAPGLTVLDAADQQEEAQAIALVLRQALEEPGARAALVTPDRGLAQRVTAELRRYGVVADDSAGETLADTPPALFLRLLAEAWVHGLRPVPLLAVLKHPFCAAGLPHAACRAQARALERKVLRGPAPAPHIGGLRQAGGDEAFLDRLEACLAPLAALGATAAPDAMLSALLGAAEALAGTEDRDGAASLWRNEDGEALADLAASLLPAFAHLPVQEVAILPGLLDAGLAGAAVSSRRALRGAAGDGQAIQEHPRVFIWGLLEARLQSADTLVLGGLTEGVWPKAADPGPWMNRAMRLKAGLPSPEEAVGQAAHDFVACACAARHAVLSAPRRRERAPAVPSRWLTRLEGLLKGIGRSLGRHDAARWARRLDRPAGDAIPVQPPAPRPAVARRPRRLSVTEIETWLRDPYAIYARHVLRLRKLTPLEESADAADYGRIVHRGMQRFHTRFELRWPPDAEAQLRACMDGALADAHLRPALAVWWRPRLHRIADWVAATEAQRRADFRLTAIRSEAEGRWVFGAPCGDFTLTGRADRIERMEDGTMAILDYKTGTAPSAKQVADGLAPQLTLEAAMIAAGAFGQDLTGPIIDLTYWQISGGHEPGLERRLFDRDAGKLAEMTADAAARLRDLVAAFDAENRAYLSQPHPGSAPRFSDYAHLARVAEWAAVDDDAQDVNQ